MAVNQADLEALAYQQDLALQGHHLFQSNYNKQPQEKTYRNRLVLKTTKEILYTVRTFCLNESSHPWLLS